VIKYLNDGKVAGEGKTKAPGGDCRLGAGDVYKINFLGQTKTN
jgi:hypothetical protein